MAPRLRLAGARLRDSSGGPRRRCASTENCCDAATNCDEAEAMLAAAEGGTFRLLCNNVELGVTTALTKDVSFDVWRATMTIGGDCIYRLEIFCTGDTGNVLIVVTADTDCPGVEWRLVLNAASLLSGSEIVLNWTGETTDDSCTCTPDEECAQGELFEVQFIP